MARSNWDIVVGKIVSSTSQGGSWEVVTFVPTDIAGCLLWLRSDLGITKDGSDKVSQWADQSGNSNHASQSTDSKKPIWTANQLNSNPSLIFTNTSQQYLSLVSNISLNALTCFVVWKASNAGGLVFGGANGDGFYRYTSTNIRLRTAANETYAQFTVTNLGNYSIIVVHRNADSAFFTLRQNGVEKATDDAVVGNMNTDYIGYRDGFYLNGGIVECGLYNSNIGSTNISTLENYLNGRYAIY